MHPTEKTTLSDLLAGTSPQVQALIANSTDETIDFVDQPTTLTPPRVGDYWHGQGGYYAGIIRDGDRQWHLILVNTPAIQAPWGTSGEFFAGQFSRRDGQHNTALILTAEPDNAIASHFTALLVEGHKDCYWPSQCENNLLFTNLHQLAERKVHWSSTPYGEDHAWCTYAHDTHQVTSCIANQYAARAVRRVLIP